MSSYNEKKSHGGDDKWIQKAHMKKGALHRALHVPVGSKIPENKLMKAARGAFGAKTEKRAKLAETLEGFHKK